MTLKNKNKKYIKPKFKKTKHYHYQMNECAYDNLQDAYDDSIFESTMYQEDFDCWPNDLLYLHTYQNIHIDWISEFHDFFNVVQLSIYRDKRRLVKSIYQKFDTY